MNHSPNFVGVYFYSLDAKNRLSIPSRMRSLLIGPRELVLSCGLEGCLNLYSSHSWIKLHEKLESTPLKNKSEQRAFKRMLYANASEVELDDDGRILISQNLIDYARLRREAAILGVGEKIEIWAKSLWLDYEKRQRNTFRRHASKLEI